MAIIIPPNTLIKDYLQNQNIPSNIQCGEGFCGACKRRCKGSVTYTIEPIAWLNDNEVLVCCALTQQSEVEIIS
ncbi:2Fe-2S iron-sulfur cluster-binding protein [Vibrio nigripulchritudo]|uniref:2Fe-2S iron-sulfur cluster-binding protein n=1 Tax=Vibrio nigripulchritudo TaxID=28173 RepID=UPI00069D7A74